MQAKRSAYSRGRNLSRSRPYVGRNTTENECVRICGVFKGKEYPDDI